LSETYAKSYVTAFETLTDSTPDEESLVFHDFSYEHVKKEILSVLEEVRKLQRLPVVNFAAGGVATPADAALMMKLGSDGVFVGSGIFKSGNPKQRAKAIVKAVAHFEEPNVIAEVSKNLGEAMVGINIDEIPDEQRLQERGW
jgi:pyridoxal 5'-phosphate synthase pdxS subunit